MELVGNQIKSLESTIYVCCAKFFLDVFVFKDTKKQDQNQDNFAHKWLEGQIDRPLQPKCFCTAQFVLQVMSL